MPMTLKNRSTAIWLSILVGWSLDLLFWNKKPGISFFIFVAITLLVGFVLLWREGYRPAAASWPLLALTLFFAAMTFVRAEGLSVAVSVLLTLTGMALLALTLRSGQWLRYSLADHVTGLFRLAGHGVVGGGQVLARPAVAPEGETPLPQPKASFWRSALPILRGLLLALPVIALLGSLLASADPIFSDWWRQLLRLFSIENWAEYIWRAFYILLAAYLLLGIYAFALTRSSEQPLLGIEKPWMPSFLGWTEAIIVLGSINLLFCAFVAIQFRYFFGGQANIHLNGFTYSEYAVRGFSELVGVAFFSLLILLGLSAVTRRETRQQQAVFSALGILLVALVAVILVSAFQRLTLYEQAYGFSRLRTYTHVFMIWLGILLAVTLALELFKNLRGFALAALLVSMGFSLSLNLINVDGLIVQQNVARAAAGYELDGTYLTSLSDDAVPALAEAFNRSPSTALHNKIGTVLSCRIHLKQNDDAERPWQSFHLADWRARQIYAQLSEQLKAYPINGEEVLCYNYWMD